MIPAENTRLVDPRALWYNLESYGYVSLYVIIPLKQAAIRFIYTRGVPGIRSGELLTCFSKDQDFRREMLGQFDLKRCLNREVQVGSKFIILHALTTYFYSSYQRNGYPVQLTGRRFVVKCFYETAWCSPTSSLVSKQ